MTFTGGSRVYADPVVNRFDFAIIGFWTCLDQWSDDHGTAGVVPNEVLAALGGTPELRTEMIAAGLASELRAGIEINGGPYTGRARVVGPGPAPAGAADSVAPRRMPCGRQSVSSPIRNKLGRDPELRQAVRDKYADQCQVCEGTVRWGKGRAADSGTYRLIDPAAGYTLENIIVACRSCGSSKGLAVGRQTAPETVPEDRYAFGNGTDNSTETVDDDDFNHHHPSSGTANQHRYAFGNGTEGESVPGPGKRTGALTAAVIEAVRKKTDGTVVITDAQAADAIKRIRERARRLGIKIGNALTYIPVVIMNEEDLFAEILCPPAHVLEQIIEDQERKAPSAGFPPMHQFAPDEHGSCTKCPLPKNSRYHLQEVVSAA